MSANDDARVQVIRTQSLMRTLELLSSGSHSDASAQDALKEDPAEGDFAGLIAVEPGQVMACAGIGIEPDRSLSLTPPMILQMHPSASAERVVRQLIAGAQQDALQNQCVRLRCMLPAEMDPGLRALLLQCRFRTVSQIGCWVAPCSVTAAANNTSATQNNDQPREEGFHRTLLGSAASEATTRGEDRETSVCRLEVLTNPMDCADALHHLLSVIAESSDDLSRLPRPEPQDLLADWRSRQCSVICAFDVRNIVGIGVVTAGIVSGDAGNCEPGNGSAPICRDSLDYIGVHPGWRRRGIAGAILRHIFRSIPSRPVQEGTLRQIAAFVDEQNTPAIHWYQQAGFQRESVATLIVHDLAVS